MAAQPRDISARPQPTPTQLPTARPLTPSEFNTALVHLYRGEISRANTWRTRLDGTTNWAVLTTGATLSFAFSSPGNTHVMILLNSLLIGFFLYIEARRYRYYDLWRARVRLMETEFFADLLVANQNDADTTHWRELLAADLLQPHFTISMWEAMGRRLRRNYSWIFTVLVLSWIVKIGIHPTRTTDIATIVDRAAIGPFPGMVVLVIGFVFNGLLILLALLTSNSFSRFTSSGEIRSREETRQQMEEVERNWWE
ncbi:MAG TPA: DUF2270 domain-containing protein [Herpetosiphonaceae bacterium]